MDLTFADTVFFTNSGAEPSNARSRPPAPITRRGNDHKFELIISKTPSTGHDGDDQRQHQDKMHKGFLPLLAGSNTPSSTIGVGQGADGPEHRRVPGRAIQGEGGIRRPGRIIQGLRALADEHD